LDTGSCIRRHQRSRQHVSRVIPEEWANEQELLPRQRGPPANTPRDPGRGSGSHTQSPPVVTPTAGYDRKDHVSSTFLGVFLLRIILDTQPSRGPEPRSGLLSVYGRRLSVSKPTHLARRALAPRVPAEPAIGGITVLRRKRGRFFLSCLSFFSFFFFLLFLPETLDVSGSHDYFSAVLSSAIQVLLAACGNRHQVGWANRSRHDSEWALTLNISRTCPSAALLYKGLANTPVAKISHSPPDFSKLYAGLAAFERGIRNGAAITNYSIVAKNAIFFRRSHTKHDQLRRQTPGGRGYPGGSIFLRTSWNSPSNQSVRANADCSTPSGPISYGRILARHHERIPGARFGWPWPQVTEILAPGLQ